MQIRIFHPYFKSSLFCKEWLNNFNENIIKIYQDENFDIKKEVEEIKTENELIFLFPLWWYNPPWNFVKWFEDIAKHKQIFKNKKIKVVVMAGGQEYRYNSKTITGIQNMNKWIDEFLNKPEWEIYYGCIPKNIDEARKVWFKHWEFEKEVSND